MLWVFTRVSTNCIDLLVTSLLKFACSRNLRIDYGERGTGVN